MTGFKTYSAFVAETNPYERRLIVESIEQYHRERDSSGGGAGPSGI